MQSLRRYYWLQIDKHIFDTQTTEILADIKARYSDKLHVAAAFNRRIYRAGVWEIPRFIHDRKVTGSIRYCIAGRRTRKICLYIAQYTGLVNRGVKCGRPEFKRGECFCKETIKNNDLLLMMMSPFADIRSKLSSPSLQLCKERSSNTLPSHHRDHLEFFTSTVTEHQETTTPWTLNFINVFTKADRPILPSLYNLADKYIHY